MELGTLLSTPAWAAATFGEADLGDQRRTQRLVYVAEHIANNPGASLPKQTQGSWADLKAVYRLLREEDVTHEEIRQPHWQHTREQANEQDEVVLFVHDDTQVDYGYDPAIKGLGPIGNGSHRGFARPQCAGGGAYPDDRAGAGSGRSGTVGAATHPAPC